MRIYAFELTMPRFNTWNGQWSGQDKRYIKIRQFVESSDVQIETRDYQYDFGDGWVANVKVSRIDRDKKAELIKISDGFLGYEWMIDSIIQHGRIITQCTSSEE